VTSALRSLPYYYAYARLHVYFSNLHEENLADGMILGFFKPLIYLWRKSSLLRNLVLKSRSLDRTWTVQYTSCRYNAFL
jgi:hypothetical protein